MLLLYWFILGSFTSVINIGQLLSTGFYTVSFVGMVLQTINTVAPQAQIYTLGPWFAPATIEPAPPIAYFSKRSIVDTRVAVLTYYCNSVLQSPYGQQLQTSASVE